MWADVHEPEQRHNAVLVLHGTPSHTKREQATAQRFRWWHVVANQAANEATSSFGMQRQLAAGTMRRAAEVGKLGRLAQERLVAIDLEVPACHGKLPRKSDDARPLVAPEQRAEQRRLEL